jgi:hypothetical protein
MNYQTHIINVMPNQHLNFISCEHSMQHPTTMRSGITIYTDEFCVRKESFLKHNTDEFCVRKESFLKHTIFSIVTSLMSATESAQTEFSF